AGHVIYNYIADRRAFRSDAIPVVDRIHFPTLIHLLRSGKRFVPLHVLPRPYPDVLDQHVMGADADPAVFQRDAGKRRGLAGDGEKTVIMAARSRANDK